LKNLPPNRTLQVKVPGGDTEVDMSELSTTGGLLNAYEAVKLASHFER
jgi:hypothetical protein